MCQLQLARCQGKPDMLTAKNQLLQDARCSNIPMFQNSKIPKAEKELEDYTKPREAFQLFSFLFSSFFFFFFFFHFCQNLILSLFLLAIFKIILNSCLQVPEFLRFSRDAICVCCQSNCFGFACTTLNAMCVKRALF